MTPREPLTKTEQESITESNRLYAKGKEKNAYIFPEQLFEPAYTTIIKHLPTYLKEPKILNYIKSHPTPMLELSLGVTNNNSDIEFVIPEDIEIEDEDAWELGATTLEELCTEKITAEIMMTVLPDTVKRLQPQIEKTLSQRLIKKHDLPYLVDVDFDKLSIAMLCGDEELKQEIATKAGFPNFNTMLVSIGQTGQDPGVSKWDQHLPKAWTSKNYGGIFKYPGVVGINIYKLAEWMLATGIIYKALNHEVLPIEIIQKVILTSTMLLAGSEVIAYPTRIVHEVVHYLASDGERSGFHKVYKP